VFTLSIISTIIAVLVLVQYGHGYVDPTQYRDDLDLVTIIEQVNHWEKLVNYCFDHADRPNPLQDLRDKGFSIIGSDCKSVKQTYDEQLGLQNKMITNYTKNNPCAPIDPAERQYYPNCKVK
jgi:hypothetical protein